MNDPNQALLFSEPTPTELAAMPVVKAAKLVGFSLDCAFCEESNHLAGSNADTYEEAISAGWTEIAYEDGAGWNFIGLCPECTKREGVT